MRPDKVWRTRGGGLQFFTEKLTERSRYKTIAVEADDPRIAGIEIDEAAYFEPLPASQRSRSSSKAREIRGRYLDTVLECYRGATGFRHSFAWGDKVVEMHAFTKLVVAHFEADDDPRLVYFHVGHILVDAGHRVHAFAPRR